ncbi:hypothetical protein RF11_04520 [Thelohanellus kitauei]|uniref:Uncharacterized protein n=1 Tax=Thelohanellus kitauei TaxID=669202 RepID=A0A0C2N198_THEKT|nr:hypothetical protein RF11_04520 [Thelohanellus kitauei]
MSRSVSIHVKLFKGFAQIDNNSFIHSEVWCGLIYACKDDPSFVKPPMTTIVFQENLKDFAIKIMMYDIAHREITSTFHFNNYNLKFIKNMSTIQILNINMQPFYNQDFNENYSMIPLLDIRIFDIACVIHDEDTFVTEFVYLEHLIHMYFTTFKPYDPDDGIRVFEPMNTSYIDYCISHHVDVVDNTDKFLYPRSLGSEDWSSDQSEDSFESGHQSSRSDTSIDNIYYSNNA